jgi:hypothetical protein
MDAKTEILKIRGCWNAGDTLSEAFQSLHKRFGFENKRVLINEWKKLKKKWGCKSIPVPFLIEVEPNLRRWNSLTESKLNADVGGGMTYGAWKGITGPGKLLKDILEQEKTEVIN